MILLDMSERERECVSLREPLRGGPLMIWGGARAKAGKKKLNGYSPWKKTQLSNLEENSTVGWPGKKSQREFSA